MQKVLCNLLSLLFVKWRMWWNYSLLNHNCTARTAAIECECACIPPTHTQHWDTKRRASGCLVSNKTEKSPREGRECRWGQQAGCEICMQKAPNIVAAVTQKAAPRLAITFIPIISAVSHPIPDIYTLLVNVLVLSICHMLLCLLRRICHKELTFITSLKVSSNFKSACPLPNFGKQNVTRQ